jgi:translation initiation factor IF-3
LFTRGKGRKETHRVNERIRVPQVRVVGPDGKQLGVMKTRDALELAYSMGLDLVEVAPTASPPVVKIMDYGKFKYEEKKRLKEAKKKQTGELKEISMRPTIDSHDLQVKMRKIREFLENGNRVKITMFFRGREIVHQDMGRDLLNRVLEELSDISVVEVPPSLEGRHLSVMVRPIKKKSGGKKDAQTEDKEVSS